MSLHDIIREVLDTTDLSAPHDVAGEVVRRLPMKQRAEALAAVLPTFIQVSFSRDRMLSRDSAASRTPTTSSKVAACRDSWEAQKSTPLLVGGDWKRLGECTAADLLVVAASLRERAAAVAAKADWYESLAAALPAGATVDVLDAKPEAA